jgi:hypothetical protein
VTDSTKLDTILPYPAPACGDARILLFALRRMAVHGLEDAFAANALLSCYGLRYRRPLVLLRAILVDIARASRRSITVATCCTPRMTGAERTLLQAIADPDDSGDAIAALMDRDEADGPMATIAALSDSLTAMGKPLRL